LDGGSARRKAATYTQHNTEEKRGYTSMPLAGFEPTILSFERLKTVRALDSAATGTGETIRVIHKFGDIRLLWYVYISRPSITNHDAPCMSLV